jgi:hypothetical protein
MKVRTRSLFSLIAVACGAAEGADCNRNGRPDAFDIRPGIALQAPRFYSTGVSPRGLALGDFDADGDLDAIFGVGGTGSTDVLRNDGAGQLAGDESYDAGVAGKSVPVDLDGDGDLDLVYSPGPLVSILENIDGAFVGPTSFPRAGSFPVNFAVGDLEGDGDPDIVAISSESGLVHFNDGGGEFPDEPDLIDGAQPSRAVALADIDGDGDLDLLNATSRGFLTFLDDGTGHFGSPTEHFAISDPSDILVGDFDGDGDQDAALMGWGVRTQAIAFNRGGGHFNSPLLFDALDDVFSLAAGDIEGDGSLDLVTVHRNRRMIAVYQNHGDGTFEGGRTMGVPDSPTMAAIGDMDGDGLADIVVTDDIGRLAVVHIGRIPAPSFDADENGLPDECELVRFHRGDVNADGFVDISDAIFLLEFLYLDHDMTPSCRDSSDANDDGSVDASDPIAILDFLFTGERAGLPFPFRQCAGDPTGDPLNCGEFKSCVQSPGDG